MQIVGRKFTHDEFKNYVGRLDINWAKFVVVHNTSAPDIALYNKWTQRAGWTPEQWLKNLTSYYAGLGWKGTPHLFIPPTKDQILVLNDLKVPGTHTPSWNKIALGVETVGEFEREPFGGYTQDNLVSALATLHDKLGFNPADYQLGVKGLHFHKEDRNTTHKTCPGRNMVKSELAHAVSAAMARGVAPVSDEEPESHVHAEGATLLVDEASDGLHLAGAVERFPEDRPDDESGTPVLDVVLGVTSEGDDARLRDLPLGECGAHHREVVDRTLRARAEHAVGIGVEGTKLRGV
jgi:hypothetical protein